MLGEGAILKGERLHGANDARGEGGVRYPLGARGYDLLEVIGKGAFATVYRARCAPSHQLTKEVAIKLMDLDKLDNIWEFIRHEIYVMSQMNHENVCKVLCSFVEGVYLWLVMPLHRGGSCKHIMGTLAPGGFRDQRIIATIIGQAANGLEYVHNTPVQASYPPRPVNADPSSLCSSCMRVCVPPQQIY